MTGHWFFFAERDTVIIAAIKTDATEVNNMLSFSFVHLQVSQMASFSWIDFFRRTCHSDSTSVRWGKVCISPSAFVMLSSSARAFWAKILVLVCGVSRFSRWDSMISFDEPLSFAFGRTNVVLVGWLFGLSVV